MILVKNSHKDDVYRHWQEVEKMESWPGNRVNIVTFFDSYHDLAWSISKITVEDIDNMYIISSDDWLYDGLCTPDFKLLTAVNNFDLSPEKTPKHVDIKEKRNIFITNPSKLDRRFILVASSPEGPYTIIEGNRRSVALASLGQLAETDVYLGISHHINSYVWARYSN